MATEIRRHYDLVVVLVRLMGVFFVVEGAVGVVGHGIDTFDQFRVARELGMRFQGSYALGWTVASFLLAAAGLGLIFKSKIAVDAVYHESMTQREPD